MKPATRMQYAAFKLAQTQAREDLGMPTKDPFDVALDEAVEGKRVCETCRSSSERVRELIQRWNDRKLAGTTKMSVKELTAYLVKNEGYPMGQTAVQSHISKCLRGHRK